MLGLYTYHRLKKYAFLWKGGKRVREHNDLALKDYTFTMADEVRAKIQSVDNLHELISEESVEDLHRVDLTDRSYLAIKRFLDIVISVLGLMVLLVPILIVAAVVYLDDPGDVIFSQNRVGRHGKKFKLYKFRTMKMETPKYMSTMELKDPDQYITRCGRFLRKTRLDELPQFWCILKGDMSVVGPRPEREAYYERFEQYVHGFSERLKVQPGLTGLAQVRGGYYLMPQEKIVYDVEYIKTRSFWLDLRIVFETVAVVFKREGAK